MKQPPWAETLVRSYESHAANQFILHGNIADKFLITKGDKTTLGNLKDFLLHVFLAHFPVVLSFDMGHGLCVEKGSQILSDWPSWKERTPLPKTPLAAADFLTHYFRYAANLVSLDRKPQQMACLLFDVQLMAPRMDGGFSYDVAAVASQIRNWSTDSVFTDQPLVSFLMVDNINDLSPLIANNSRAVRVPIPLPSAEEISDGLSVLKSQHKTVITTGYSDETIATQLTGAELSSIENLIKIKGFQKEILKDQDLIALKKRMIENDCNGLIEFLQSKRSFDDLFGLEKVKEWLKQDIALWKQNDINAIPKGYLLSGPVGTGKTFLVECLAGEASVPVVKFKNFRDKWVGSSEGNLEKIFRLLRALGRCYVFIDEADQSLGKRDSGNGDSGLSGRIYSMMAEEMSNSESRGKIIWILASSRPDLIEVDLKRPGRVDVKIPLFPTTTVEESFYLLKKLFSRKNIDFENSDLKTLESKLPLLLTPGAADTLVMKVYRLVKTSQISPLDALTKCLADYRNPVPLDVLQFQIDLAIRETSDLDFVPQTLFNQKKT